MYMRMCMYYAYVHVHVCVVLVYYVNVRVHVCVMLMKMWCAGTCDCDEGFGGLDCAEVRCANNCTQVLYTCVYIYIYIIYLRTIIGAKMSVMHQWRHTHVSQMTYREPIIVRRYICVYKSIHAYTHIYVYLYISIHIYIYTYVYTYMCICKDIRKYMYIHIYVCIYTCIYIYICIYMDVRM